jgi:hypothetical protein
MDKSGQEDPKEKNKGKTDQVAREACQFNYCDITT